MGGYGWALLSVTLGVTMYARRLGNNMGFSSPSEAFLGYHQGSEFPRGSLLLAIKCQKIEVSADVSFRANKCLSVVWRSRLSIGLCSESYRYR